MWARPQSKSTGQTQSAGLRDEVAVMGVDIAVPCTQVTIRRADVTDADGLRRFLSGLSERTTYRRFFTGLGRRLIAGLLDTAESHGVGEVRFTILAGNQPAARFAARLWPGVRPEINQGVYEYALPVAAGAARFSSPARQ